MKGMKEEPHCGCSRLLQVPSADLQDFVQVTSKQSEVLGSSFSTEEEQTLHDVVFAGLNPSWFWPLFLLYFPFLLSGPFKRNISLACEMLS